MPRIEEMPRVRGRDESYKGEKAARDMEATCTRNQAQESRRLSYHSKQLGGFNPQLLQLWEDHERGCRGYQQQDQAHQAQGLWLSKQWQFSSTNPCRMW